MDTDISTGKRSKGFNTVVSAVTEKVQVARMRISGYAEVPNEENEIN
jgi:hypothetical protein